MFDTEAEARGERARDPFSQTQRGERALGVACRLGPSCETWAIAMEKLARDVLRLPYEIQLPPSLELNFRVRYKLRDARKVEDAFRRLASKFGAHLNVYYAGSEPWGMDVSKQMYLRD